ncbi:MAG: hypothetical protein Q4D13_05695 [Erysipelotrichaceae bacterium]|nr:hypothetical protein [Erysipelotrichaceae bacterium]
MTTLIYYFIRIITKFHTWFLSLNDSSGLMLSDKQLHFLVIGMLGFGMMLVIQPIFNWIAKKNAVVLITFTYVFSFIVCLSFAIEIGQGISGTGDMDFRDILSGLVGFFVFVGIYLVLYAIYRWIKRDKKEKELEQDEHTDQ